MVEPVFGEEEALGVGCVRVAAASDHYHVAAGAKATALGMVDDDRFDAFVVHPAEQSRAHRLAHRGGERVDRLGAVEADAADPVLGRNQHIFGHIADEVHWRSSSRLTMTRMIWLVPSRIEWTRRARQKRSSG